MPNLIDNGDGTHTVNVPIIIPNAALDVGGIELFAGAYGWTAKILDEQGNEIDNPESALDKSIAVVKAFLSEVFKAEYIKFKENEAREQAIVEADTILGE